MTAVGLEAFRQDSAVVCELIDGLTEAELSQPSACAGWTVRDVIAHMGCALQEFVDLASLPPVDPTQHTERRQDDLVNRTAEWDWPTVVAHYRAMKDATLVGLDKIKDIDTPVPLGDLGTHPLHLVADGFAFDHYLHLRADLLAPRGPLDRPQLPAEGDGLAATLNWMCAAFPQQNAAELASLRGTVRLDLVGSSARRLCVHLAESGVAVDDVRHPNTGQPDAVVISSASSFPLWATKRERWQDCGVSTEGDEALAHAFCDALRVY